MTLTATPGADACATQHDAEIGDLRQRLKLAELQLAQARTATAEASSSKAEFIANISHELRTPLQTILGFSEMGASVAQARVGHSDYADMFRDICAGGQRMLGLVNALLDVASVGSSVAPLCLQRVDLVELIQSVVSASKGQTQTQTQTTTKMQRRALHLSLSFEPAAHPVWAWVDAARMQQVLRHVLLNAQRFAAGTTAHITCAEQAVNGITITVRDHGPGIPDDELEAVFNPCVQSSRTRDGSSGAGLGLTVCRKVMAAHGGSIQAANALGGGCVISIHLPHGTAEQGSAASGAESQE